MYELGGVRVTQPTHLTCFQYSRIRREDAAALGVRCAARIPTKHGRPWRCTVRNQSARQRHAHACIAIPVQLFEATQPFTNGRWFLHTAGYKDTTLYLVNGAMMFISFFRNRRGDMEAGVARAPVPRP